MTKDTQIDKLIINNKKALANAEKQLIALRKQANGGNVDEALAKIIINNYQVAKKNLAVVEQLANGGKDNKRPDQATRVGARGQQASVVKPQAAKAKTTKATITLNSAKTTATKVQSAKSSAAKSRPAKAEQSKARQKKVTFKFAAQPTAKSAAPTKLTFPSSAQSAVKLTRHQYREELKHHHK